MKSKILFLLFFIPCCYFSQDGSDILYLKTSEISKEIQGKFIHIDFYNKSFGRKRIQDSIDLPINKNITRFQEVRNDTGFNNWFDKQSLLSVSKIDSKKLQIEKFQLTGFDDRNLYVTAFINYLKNDKIVKKSKEEMIIERSKIVEILVKNE
ncbi:hypothetical protein BA768_11755 [Chryseobacterium sp. CBo1]|uniref:hypothetical protein n=1 Tax=Chryseobacterium sp. CBo1 TaxID=1869230 RepID=UPI0008107CC0|nr:hypothetical protein [Chryseobacterium sp. CBo1]OCK52527.1 hypothetical protein BA768_11755 [Chryseobacterium sp. CBo1]